MELVFPVIMLKSGDPAVHVFSGNVFGLVSKGGESFYSKGIIYDATGNSFRINGVKSIQNASFIESLRFFQKMRKVALDLDFLEQVSLEGVKELLGQHIRKHPKYWASRDNVKNIVDQMAPIDNFETLAKYLR